MKGLQSIAVLAKPKLRLCGENLESYFNERDFGAG